MLSSIAQVGKCNEVLGGQSVGCSHNVVFVFESFGFYNFENDLVMLQKTLESQITTIDILVSISWNWHSRWYISVSVMERSLDKL
jgi:hypothetical protein